MLWLDKGLVLACFREFNKVKTIERFDKVFSNFIPLLYYFLSFILIPALEDD